MSKEIIIFELAGYKIAQIPYLDGFINLWLNKPTHYKIYRAFVNA